MIVSVDVRVAPVSVAGVKPPVMPAGRPTSDSAMSDVRLVLTMATVELPEPPGATIKEVGDAEIVKLAVPLHKPPAPFAIGAVAHGEYEARGVPARMFCGPEALPHQLQVALTMFGAVVAPGNASGRKTGVKSLPVIVRDEAVADVLSTRSAP